VLGEVVGIIPVIQNMQNADVTLLALRVRKVLTLLAIGDFITSHQLQMLLQLTVAFNGYDKPF
jgi:hypothetical protein